jgi:hypothetical protein
MLSSQEWDGPGTCDLLIDRLMPKSDLLSARVRLEGLFSSVMCTVCDYPLFRHQGASIVLDTTVGQEASRRRFYEVCPSLEGREYDVLLCGSATRMTFDAKRYCVPNGVTYFFDEGTGSHNGNVFKMMSCFDDVLDVRSLGTPSERLKRHAKRAASLMIGRSSLEYSIKGLFLFSPRECDRSRFRGVPLLEIPEPADPGILRRVFCQDGSATNYADKALIYFTLPRCLPAKTLKAEGEVVARLYSLYGEKLGVRLHPNRSREDFRDMEGVVLGSEDNWEALLASHAVSSQAVLLAICSSTLIHPKMIFGIEQPVSFLFRLTSCEGLSLPSCEETFEDLRHEYSNESLVTAPESWKDLEHFLAIHVV